MTFCWNQLCGRWVASVLTAVGALRVSTGPPIMVSVCGPPLGLVGAHHRGRGKRRDRRLAHRQHDAARSPRISPIMLEEVDQIIDIIVEVEAAVAQRHQLRVAPVGDVDVVVGQHPLDRAAQQRRIVAAHRRDDQQRRPALLAPSLHEMLELAERLASAISSRTATGFLPILTSLMPEFRLAARRRRRGRTRRGPPPTTGPIEP